jgi:DNA-binding NarL/FixJ family response regulator
MSIEAPEHATELRILLALTRPLLRRGLQHWLAESRPGARVLTIDEPVDLESSLRSFRPRVLLAEPGVLLRARIPAEQLPRVLLFSSAPHCAERASPNSLSACGQLSDGLDDRALDAALDCVLSCSRDQASDCASRLCPLRASGGPPSLGLSGREQEVFERLGAGEAPREIAAALGLSVKTVEHYRAQIKDKLALRDSRELLEFAVLWRRGLATRPSQLRSL